jgi:hypothetical protein
MLQVGHEDLDAQYRWPLHSKILFQYDGLTALWWCPTIPVFSLEKICPTKSAIISMAYCPRQSVHWRSAWLPHTLGIKMCICNKSLEYSIHLFIHCHFACTLWMKFLSWWGISSVFPKSVDDMFYQWFSMVKGKQQNLSWQLLFSCVVWNLWLYRNDVIFNGVTPNL